MRARIACAALAVLTGPAIGGAQTLSLTETEALARLSSESPRVQAARAGIDVARADVLAASRWPNPRLTISREAVAGVAERMVVVSQPLPITGRRGLETNAASARVDAVALRADDQVRRLRADLRLAFSSLVAAQAREREMASTVAKLRELSQVLALREAAGEGAGFDHLRAEREAFDVEAERALAAAERERAQATLASFFASADPIAIDAVAEPLPPAPLPTVDALFARAETARPEFAALRREVDAAALSERAASRRRIPEPELSAGTKSSNAVGGDVGSVLSVHLSLPLFDRGAPERAAAQARAQQLTAEAAALRQMMRADILTWRAAAERRREIAQQYRTAVVPGAGEIERIAQVSYDAGDRGILELLDAYRTGSAARVRQAALDAAAREAEIELEFASGWERP